jgi:CheY-like chemotaxis protein/HPt (histidine-containing phosphotransfer) domain-containing protein
MGQRLPLRILLAEDNRNNQKLALHILERLGYRADVAGNGLEALEALERQSYDVVLMDVQMPEMDGLEASRLLRQQWSDGERPYIIAMTANALQGDREMCLTAGMDDYISKPIHVEELVAALSKSRPHARAPLPTAETKAELHVPQRVDGNAPSIAPSVVLDAAKLHGLRAMVGGDETFLAEMIDTFFEDAPRLLADLRRAVEQGDGAKARLAAHSLKSNGADFGAKRFAALCQEMETLGKSGALGGATELLSQIEAAYAEMRLALEEVRAR